MKRLKHIWWKRQLKRRWSNYINIMDEYSCGSSLTFHISSRARNAVDAVNVAIRKLKEVDPNLTLSEIKQND